MNIALLGYGKMGKVIEGIALQRNHTISVIVDNDNDWITKKDQLSKVDLAIDFSTPDTILANIDNCFELNIPIVIGTTGWYNQIESIKKKCEYKNQSLLWASNFSIGVNIFFKVNQMLAKLMNNYSDYEVEMGEIHHTGKLDAPSGTAISLANDIIEQLDRKNNWELDNSTSKESLSIYSQRIDPVPGTHSIVYNSNIDTLEIKHTAKNREGFAMGAILAAEWLQNRHGFYEFKKVFF